MSLIKICQDEIYSYYKNNSKRAECIICHPKTLQNLIEEYGVNASFDVQHPSVARPRFEYQGLTVYRSFDIEENKFIIT